MDSKTYIDLALRTESHPASLGMNLGSSLRMLQLLVAAGNLADTFKRGVFYGKGLNDAKLDAQLYDMQVALDAMRAAQHRMPFTEDAPTALSAPNLRVLHAGVGMYSESAEILEALVKQITSGTLDIINVGEEGGDVDWYKAILHDETGVSEAQCRETNIAKLAKRYGDKFTDFAANNRDLAAERAVLEQGMGVGFFAWEDRPDWVGEGDDMAKVLGIEKYEPVVPAQMAGRVSGGDLDATFGYDFENLKKCPNLFDDGMEVVITEKLHGTLLQVALIPEAIYAGKTWVEKATRIGSPGGPDYAVVVTSKGQGAKGLMLDISDESNLYVKTVLELGLHDKLLSLRNSVGAPEDKPIFLFGEIFGDVQDLTYGMAPGKTTFRAFDVYVGTRTEGYFLDYRTFQRECNAAYIERVPVLEVGPFSKELVAKHTDGTSTLAPKQIREGVVVKATKDPRHPRYGRRIAKSVSEAYLLRKNTNATEFQ